MSWPWNLNLSWNNTSKGLPFRNIIIFDGKIVNVNHVFEVQSSPNLWSEVKGMTKNEKRKRWRQGREESYKEFKLSFAPFILITPTVIWVRITRSRYSRMWQCDSAFSIVYKIFHDTFMQSLSIACMARLIIMIWKIVATIKSWLCPSWNMKY